MGNAAMIGLISTGQLGTTDERDSGPDRRQLVVCSRAVQARAENDGRTSESDAAPRGATSGRRPVGIPLAQHAAGGASNPVPL